MSEASGRWRRYYDKTAGRPARQTLLAALDAFARDGREPAERFAVDLGCGNGRDAIELLKRGWSVLAIDSEPAAIEELSRRADLPPGARLRTQVGRSRPPNGLPATWSMPASACPWCRAGPLPVYDCALSPRCGQAAALPASSMANATAGPATRA